MIAFYLLTSDEYNDMIQYSSSSLNEDAIYFLSDTKEIYKGTTLFTDFVVLYDTKPANPSIKKIYINSSTLVGEIYNGLEWITIFRPISGTISTGDESPINSDAVINYITSLNLKTPERGVDYWTEDDINTIKGYVDNAILNGEW